MGVNAGHLTKELERSIEAAIIWYIRRIMRISWTEKKSNDRVMEMAGYKKIPTQNHQKKTTTIVWAYKKADGLEKQILSEKIHGAKRRVRQRTKYPDSLNNFLTRQESSNNELIRRTDDREEQKAMIVDVCSRPGT